MRRSTSRTPPGIPRGLRGRRGRTDCSPQVSSELECRHRVSSGVSRVAPGVGRRRPASMAEPLPDAGAR
jgi:hypothetical protein